MLIRIVGELPGRLDAEMRRAWIGVEIKILTQENLSLPSTLDPHSQEQKAFVVNRADAVKSLREAGKHEAADYWDGLLVPRFLFPVSICEVITEKTEVN